MLVVLEGLDGAGKSTQVKRLRTYLEGLFDDFEYIHFPRYDAPVFGDLIGKFLRGGFGSIDEVHPQLVALLYALDRRDAAASIREVVGRGGCVLLDRYVYSNVAYQCAKVHDMEERELLREWILNTEYGHFGEPVPDLNIFLDVPTGFVASKLEAQRHGSDRDYLGGGRDIHEASMDFQKAVREVYVRQASVDPRFIRIVCSSAEGEMLPPDDIAAMVRTVVDNHIQGR